MRRSTAAWRSVQWGSSRPSRRSAPRFRSASTSSAATRPRRSNGAASSPHSAGVVLLAREPSGGRVGRAGLAAGVSLALVAALGFGMFIVGLDAASDGGATWAVVVARTSSTLVALCAALVVSVPLRPPTSLVPAIVAVGVFDTTANVLVALATTYGSAGIVAVLSALYPLTTIVLAWIFLSERLDRTQRARRSARPCRRRACRCRLDVEADVQHVAVGDDVGLALEPLCAAPRSLGVRAGIEQVLRRDHLAADEAARDVGVDRRRRLERGLAPPERPRARLLLARGEERDQPERLLELADDLVERGRPVAELRRLLLRELGELRLELAVDPPGPVLDREEGLRRQRVERLRELARPVGERPTARPGGRAAPRAPPASAREAGSPDFASFATRSWRRST